VAFQRTFFLLEFLKYFRGLHHKSHVHFLSILTRSVTFIFRQAAPVLQKYFKPRNNHGDGKMINKLFRTEDVLVHLYTRFSEKSYVAYIQISVLQTTSVFFPAEA
jgi:hypothetical protein